MKLNVLAFRVIEVLAGQADQSTPAKAARFNIIRQAVEDLGDPGIAVDINDYPPDLYFSNLEFEEDADACGLNTEYVHEVLEASGLMKDGRRVYENTEFLAA